MNTLPNPTLTFQTGELGKALLQAQSAIRAIPHDARNDYHNYGYTSAEAIISECKTALAAAGLSLLPTGQSLTITDGTVFLSRQFTLFHASGEELLLTTAWPVVPEKGRPLDKAAASATTTSLAYLLRDLLLAPRVDPADDLAGREDRPEPAKKKANPPPAPKQAPAPIPSPKIGREGAVKLVELAEKKGVQLPEFTKKVACNGTAVDDLTQPQARNLWKMLSALPDPKPTTNGTATANNRVPF